MTRVQMAPPSPNGSVYDLSDDEEDEYNTIMRSSSGKGVKLLFSKSKVYVHPTPSSKDNIPGFVALIQQKPNEPVAESSATVRPSVSASTSSQTAKASSYLLSWVPEAGLGSTRDSYDRVESNDGSSPPRRIPLVPAPPTSSARESLIGYAFSVPLSEVYSLLIRPPSLGWWYGSVVINTKSGDSFPALFFHDDECESTILQKKRMVRESFDPFGESGTFWGGDEVLRWLRKYVKVERSGAEQSIYLVNPTAEDLLGFSEAAPESPRSARSADASAPGPSASSSRPAEPAQRSQNAAASGVSGARANDAGMDAFTRALKQARWGFLEKMSQVTTFTRRTAQDVLENPNVPPPVRRLMRDPNVQTMQDEYDSARVYLARWAMGIAEQGERDRTARMWTARDVLDLEDGELGEFEILDAENMSIADRRKPVKLAEWEDFFDPVTGRLRITPDEVKERIFHGGLDPDDGVRKEAWLFLLGVYEWDSSAEERAAMMASRRDEYVRLKGDWWERMVEGHDNAETAEWWREQRNRIEKDVHRTDRHLPIFEGEDIPHPDPDSPFADVGTNVHLEQMKDMLLTYNEYNKDLGYVQGMSDLLAPIYAVEQDDAVAFWAFVNFMDRMERNFLRDQSGMRRQLVTLDQLVALMDPKLYQHLQKADSTNFFFFFRMLLVWYKREFDWADVLRLWEGFWTDYLSSEFHLFVALAILEKHRDVIMTHLQHFDEVLKYVNELSGTMELESTLRRAEALFRRFQKTVEAIDKQSNFPEAPVRRRLAGGTSSPPASPGAEGPSTSRAQQGRVQGQSQGSGSDARTADGAMPKPEKPKTISPELRGLLSRKPPTMDKKEVREHGGGVGS